MAYLSDGPDRSYRTENTSLSFEHYEDMQIMLFGETPRFSSILSTLKELEDAINSLRKVLSRSASEGAFE